MTSLSDTIADLTALTEPSREMDARVAYLVDDVRTETSTWREVVEVFKCEWPELARQADSHQSIWSSLVPRYTASKDAAIALAERALPGVTWRLTKHLDHAGRPSVLYDFVLWLSGHKTVADHSCDAIAILIGTLNALDKESGDG